MPCKRGECGGYRGLGAVGRGDGDFAHAAPLYAPGDQNPGPESLESGHFVHKVSDRGWCDWRGLAPRGWAAGRGPG